MIKSIRKRRRDRTRNRINSDNQNKIGEVLWREEEMLEMYRIEEECKCDIIAGVDHGANLGNYIAQAMGIIND